MRTSGVAAALALVLVTGGAVASAAVADDHGVPSRREVHDSRVAVQQAADTVAGVRAQLVVADQRLEQTAIAAGQASEAYNGARWRAAQARQAARSAQQRAQVAAADLVEQQQAYAHAMVASYEMSPGLTALSAVISSEGIGTVVERTTSLHNAANALDTTYQRYRAASTLADLASQQAQDAETDAVDAADAAREAKQSAQAAADRAATEASAIAAQKSTLIAQLARLQHVSVRLAERRQSALEQQAAQAAADAAQEQAQQQAQEQAQQQAAPAADPTPSAEPTPSSSSTPSPTPDPTTAPTPAPSPAPAPPSAPAPASGVGAAIAFARAQIGEPYVWGAAGPGSWDCSGLTMGAWRAGGRSLPHYSVAQYEQSTPIAASQLQPGDLVFWGSSSDPSSIYHVALYVGNGQIIHAPRTGEDVQEVSMYYWIAPNFYARP